MKSELQELIDAAVKAEDELSILGYDELADELRRAISIAKEALLAAEESDE